MRTKVENKNGVTGLSSRATAERLATILLVIPGNVMAFQGNEPNKIELRTSDRVAIVRVEEHSTRVETAVEGRNPRLVECADMEVARRLHRFFK